MVRKKKRKDQSIGVALGLPRVEVSAPEAAGCTRRSCPLPCPATKKTKQKQSVVIVPAPPATSIQYMQCHWLTAAQVAVSSRACRVPNLAAPILATPTRVGARRRGAIFWLPCTEAVLCHT